jgi:hypothetical protein
MINFQIFARFYLRFLAGTGALANDAPDWALAVKQTPPRARSKVASDMVPMECVLQTFAASDRKICPV